MEKEGAEWNENTNYALGLYRVVARILGVWPLDNRKLISMVATTVMIAIQAMAIIIYTKSWMDNGNCGTITELMNGISLITGSATVIVKALILRIHRTRMLSLVNSVVDDWMSAKDKKSSDIMLQYAHAGRLVLILFMAGEKITVVFVILSKSPNFVRVDDVYNNTIFSRNIPILPNCWLSQDMSPFLYLIFYFYICMQSLMVVTMDVGADELSFGLAMHLWGQFELLNESSKAIDDNESEKIQRQKLSEFSQRHTHLLKLAGELEEIFNIIILLEIGTDTMIITVSELLVVRAFKIWDIQLIMLMTATSYILYLQIFMYSFIGEKLSSKAEQLKVSVYNIRWCNMSPNITKQWKFIIMRTDCSFHVIAGRFCSMNFQNFAMVVKSTFSYVSILRLLIDE